MSPVNGSVSPGRKSNCHLLGIQTPCQCLLCKTSIVSSTDSNQRPTQSLPGSCPAAFIQQLSQSSWQSLACAVSMKPLPAQRPCAGCALGTDLLSKGSQISVVDIWGFLSWQQQSLIVSHSYLALFDIGSLLQESPCNEKIGCHVLPNRIKENLNGDLNE